MKIRRVIFLFLFKVNLALAGSASFVTDGGNWSDTSSWDPNTVPNSTTDVATFTSDVGTFAGSNVDGTFSVASLNFTTAFQLFLNGGILNIYDSIYVSAAAGGANCATTLNLQNDISIVTDAQLACSSIEGTGGIIKTGASILSVSNTSTYSGSTYINEGIFRAGAFDALSPNSAIILANAAGVELNNQGTTQTILSLSGGGNLGGEVTFDNAGAGALTLGDSNDTTFSGVISGEGEIIKNGSGTFTLNGTNTYTEGTTLSAGAITLGSNAALGTGALSMFNETTLNLNLGVSVSNAINLDGATTIGVPSGTGTLSGVISGAGGVFSKTGEGTLILSGDSSSFTGNVTVAEGELMLTGEIGSAITINSGARLSGTGTAGSITSSGAVAPGDATATLTSGSVVLTSNSTYEVELNPTSATVLDITGTATLGGTLVVTQSEGSYANTGQYTILQTTGGITGSFTTLTFNALSGYTFTAEVRDNSIVVSYSPTPVTADNPSSGDGSFGCSLNLSSHSRDFSALVISLLIAMTLFLIRRAKKN